MGSILAGELKMSYAMQCSKKNLKTRGIGISLLNIVIWLLKFQVPESLVMSSLMAELMVLRVSEGVCMYLCVSEVVLNLFQASFLRKG